MGDESVEHEDTLIGLQVEVRAAERELFEARLRRAMAMREANLAGRVEVPDRAGDGLVADRGGQGARPG